MEKTTNELLRGRKPSITHLRCFGCKCFIHNNGKDNLGKFNPKSDEAIFVGYSLHSRAYKVYNKRTMRIEESIHVTFDESKKGTENLPDPDDEEFIISYSEESQVPFIAQDPILDMLSVSNDYPEVNPKDIPTDEAEHEVRGGARKFEGVGGI